MRKEDPYSKVHIHIILEPDSSVSAQMSFCRETWVWDAGKGVSKVCPGSQVKSDSLVHCRVRGGQETTQSLGHKVRKAGV